MCGIAGVIGLSSSTLSNQLINKISHRGPDGAGFGFHPQANIPSRCVILDYLY